ncbi:MAG TPA: sigma 54-interacting transcriptional regulator [Desulfomonilia bacterium]
MKAKGKTSSELTGGRKEATQSILESISDGVFTVNENWIITSFNRAAENITGVSRTDAIGKSCSDVFRSSMCESECALKKTLKSGKPVIGKSGYIINSKGDKVPISVSTAMFKNEKGEVIGGAETFRDLSEIENLRREVEGRFKIGDIISHSPLMHRIFDVLPAIASSPSTVLLLGETGTGKELVARTIHSLSFRKNHPFIAVNCAALPDSLLESELFGYKAGAFTGARKDKPGRFAIAKSGTIFLDEIGDISPALQVRLLRVLQDRTFEPLGSTRPEKTDARVIVATNKDLSAMTKQGAFREDLYYRVNVVRLELPPLRRRKEDIPLLAEEFIKRFNLIQNKRIEGISSEAISLLMAHDWPGNVRELENIIERAFITCTKGQIDIEHIQSEFMPEQEKASCITDMRTTRNILEAETIRKVLEKTSYNRLKTARELGIHKSTLFRKIKKLNIIIPER